MSKKEQEQKSAPVYSDTAYDDAFRTMEGLCDDLLIPFVSHMFGENYDKTAVVKRLRNERFVEHEDGSEEERTTDSFFEITYKNVTKRYHLECESKPYDGSILVRIFEYDTQIAKVNNELSPYKMRFKFPNSGLLLLRTSNEETESAEIELVMPDGRNISYNVSIIKMSDYSIDDLFEKRLYMLIPFYIFNYEPQLPDMNVSSDKIENLLEKYRDIFDRLDAEMKQGNLSAASFGAIMRLTYKVAYKLTMKETNVQEKVGDFMGGKILDLPEFRILAQAKEELRTQFEDENRKLIDENGKLADENGKLADENGKLADENDKLADENDKLADENDKLADENDKLRRENEDLRKKLEALEAV